MRLPPEAAEITGLSCEPGVKAKTLELRVQLAGAVQIRNLKRFVMDKLGATYRSPAAPVTR